MILYVISNQTNRCVAEITGESNAECEAKAAEAGWDNHDYDGWHWTYSPAFGFEGGALPPNPTLDRLLLLLKQGGYSQRGAAKELEISERMMRYYCAGTKPVPRSVMLALEHLVNCPPLGGNKMKLEACLSGPSWATGPRTEVESVAAAKEFAESYGNTASLCNVYQDDKLVAQIENHKGRWIITQQ